MADPVVSDPLEDNSDAESTGVPPGKTTSLLNSFSEAESEMIPETSSEQSEPGTPRKKRGRGRPRKKPPRTAPKTRGRGKIHPMDDPEDSDARKHPGELGREIHGDSWRTIGGALTMALGPDDYTQTQLRRGQQWVDRVTRRRNTSYMLDAINPNSSESENEELPMPDERFRKADPAAGNAVERVSRTLRTFYKVPFEKPDPRIGRFLRDFVAYSDDNGLNYQQMRDLLGSFFEGDLYHVVSTMLKRSSLPETLQGLYDRVGGGQSQAEQFLRRYQNFSLDSKKPFGDQILALSQLALIAFPDLDRCANELVVRERVAAELPNNLAFKFRKFIRTYQRKHQGRSPPLQRFANKVQQLQEETAPVRGTSVKHVTSEFIPEQEFNAASAVDEDTGVLVSPVRQVRFERPKEPQRHQPSQYSSRNSPPTQYSSHNVDLQQQIRYDQQSRQKEIETLKDSIKGLTDVVQNLNVTKECGANRGPTEFRGTWRTETKPASRDASPYSGQTRLGRSQEREPSPGAPWGDYSFLKQGTKEFAEATEGLDYALLYETIPVTTRETVGPPYEFEKGKWKPTRDIPPQVPATMDALVKSGTGRVSLSRRVKDFFKGRCIVCGLYNHRPKHKLCPYYEAPNSWDVCPICRMGFHPKGSCTIHEDFLK